MGKNAQRRNAKREAEWLANMGESRPLAPRRLGDKQLAKGLRIRYPMKQSREANEP